MNSIADKNSFRKLINKRINSIIGLSLQSLENNLLPENKDKYEKLRYEIMKFCNDMSRKIDSDLEDFTINRVIHKYVMPYKEFPENG